MTSPAPSYIDLLPAPGEWTEADYFPFSERGRLVEPSDGNLEVVDLPNDFHPLILLRLALLLQTFVSDHKLGKVRFAPLPVLLWSGKIREPDLMFMSIEHASTRIGHYWGVPDLAVEIISEGSAYKDREIKLQEYQRAGVGEYWIIDPVEKTVEIFEARGNYESARLYAATETLTSALFEGFSLSVADLFAEEE